MDSGLLIPYDRSNYVPYLLPFSPVIILKRNQWVHDHVDVVREAMNEHRNYVQSRCKEAIEAWSKAIDQDGGLPSTDEILAIATRDLPNKDVMVDGKSEYARYLKIFVWWWDTFLPAVAGHKYWRPSIRTTQNITTAMFNGNQCIPKGTEAFAVLVFENCYDKWKLMITETENFTKKIIIPKKKSDDDTQKYAGKYSSSRLGQAAFGGWSPEGKKRFNELCRMIGDVREKNEDPGLETEVLKLVRQVHNLPAEVDDEAAEASKKRKKRKRDPVVVELVDCDMDD